jgi:mannose PTS system EIIA component
MKNDTKIVIVSHGIFGEVLLKTVERMLGKQKSIFVVNVESNDRVLKVTNKIKKIVEKFRKKGVLIMVDIVGGTPFNISCKFIRFKNVEVVTGMNVNMLLSAVQNKEDITLERLVKKVVLDSKKFTFRVKDCCVKF